MLSVRLAVKNFVINRDDKSVQTYRQLFSTMETDIKDIKERGKNPERAKLVAFVEENLQQYNQALKWLFLSTSGKTLSPNSAP